MHPNVLIIVGAAILRVKDLLLRCVATAIFRFIPMRIDVLYQYLMASTVAIVLKASNLQAFHPAGISAVSTLLCIKQITA